MAKILRAERRSYLAGYGFKQKTHDDQNRQKPIGFRLLPAKNRLFASFEARFRRFFEKTELVMD